MMNLFQQKDFGGGWTTLTIVAKVVRVILPHNISKNLVAEPKRGEVGDISNFKFSRLRNLYLVCKAVNSTSSVVKRKENKQSDRLQFKVFQ